MKAYTKWTIVLGLTLFIGAVFLWRGGHLASRETADNDVGVVGAPSIPDHQLEANDLERENSDRDSIETRAQILVQVDSVPAIRSLPSISNRNKTITLPAGRNITVLQTQECPTAILECCITQGERP